MPRTPFAGDMAASPATTAPPGGNGAPRSDGAAEKGAASQRPDGSTPAEPTARQNGSEGAKTARVVARIRDMILTDALPPGSPVRERALAETLMVSRTPMREALKILAAEGLIELHQHRGAFVAAPTDKEILEILELLSVVEGFAAELAAKRITRAEVQELWALHHEMVATFLRGDKLGYFHRNQDIHHGIVKAARNAEVARQHRVLNARVYRVRFKCNLVAEEWHGAIDEHRALLTALERGEAAEAAAIQRRHVFGAWDRMEGLLTKAAVI